LTAIQKFYLHDANSAVSGTLPTGEHSASSPSVTASGATTPRTMTGTAGSSQASAALTTGANNSAQPSWFRTFVSVPLAAQTIGAGNWQLSLAGKEANASSNLHFTAVIYAWRPSTGAVVGSLITDVASASTTEPGTGQTAVNDTTIAGTAVEIADGDVLVCEIWRDATVQQGTATAYLNTVYYDGTTEASTTNEAAFILAPTNIFPQGDTAPTFGITTGYPQGAGAGANNTTAIALNPGSAVGDVLFLIVGIGSTSITSSGVSSSKSTGWTKVKSYVDSTATWTMEVWMGTCNSTGTHTVTVTYSGSVAAITGEIDAYSFHSSRTSPVWWVATTGGQHDTASTTPAMPTLTPSVDGSQAYLGAVEPANTSQAGATAKYTYTVLDSAWLTGAQSIGVVGAQSPATAQNTSGTATAVGIIFSDAPISGTGSAGVKKPSLAGTATNTGGGSDSGTGSIALKKPSISIAANEKISGTGSAGVKKPSLSLAGKPRYLITGSAGMKKPSLSLAGKPRYLITGSVSLKKPSLDLSGVEEEPGTGSVSLKKPSVAASGKPKYIATGSLGLKKPALSVSASEKISGTGSASLKKPAISGTNESITKYSLFPSTDGPSSGTDSDDSKYTFGLHFKVTDTGVKFYGYRLWVASDQNTAAQDFALWHWTTNPATYVSSSLITSGTLIAGQWNDVLLSVPIDLTNGEEYISVRSVNKTGLTGGRYYSHSSHYWDTGDGAAGITNGPLYAFYDSEEPQGLGQMTFYVASGSVDVTDPAQFPGSEFNSSHYWSDVIVGTGSVPDTGTGSIALKKPSLSLAGKPRYLITGSAGMKKPSLSGSGPAEKISGTGSCGIKKPSLSLSGKEKVSATGSIAVKKPAISIAAKEKISGTGSCGVKKPSLSGSGPAEKISGTGSISLKKPNIHGSSSTLIAGSGGASLKKPSLSGSGPAEKISGTGSCGVKKPAISISAKEKTSGTGSCGVKKPHISAVGREEISGTGSCGIKKPVLTLSGKEREAATGSVSLKKPHISGSGTVAYRATGTGSLAVKKPHLDLEGTEAIYGSGDLHMKKMRLEAHQSSIPSNALFIFTSV
jgi:hypothetical protein